MKESIKKNYPRLQNAKQPALNSKDLKNTNTVEPVSEPVEEWTNRYSNQVQDIATKTASKPSIIQTKGKPFEGTEEETTIEILGDGGC